MLQIWKLIESGSIVYGYADKGLDYVNGVNDKVGIMLISPTTGQSLGYWKQGELKKVASFQGYHNTDF